MKLSPPQQGRSETSFREAKKQARAFDGGIPVRVVSEGDFLVGRLDSAKDAERIRRFLAAPNAVPVRRRDGKLVAIRLLALGDDRGNSGERHGRSTVTTERVRNDFGNYIGGDRNLKHKNLPVPTSPKISAR